MSNTNYLVESEAQAEVKNYADDFRITQQTRNFLKGLNTAGAPPLETLSAEDARKVLEGGQLAFTVDLSGIEESEKTITAGGYTIILNIVRPEGVKEKLPAFLFIHGGGWVIGDYPTHKRMVRDLVVLTGCCAIFVNYTRTPEAKYPQALNEIYSALEWIAKNGSEINVDGKNLAIAGNSAGGNLAAATALKAKLNNGPELKVQILFWPVIEADFETESYRKYAEDRFLTANMMKWMWNLYTDESERKEIYASPVHASLDELRGLPPTLIQTAENDVLRDEGEAYGRKLDDAGVKVTTIRYNGMIHDFGLLNGLAELPATRSLFEHAAAEIKKYLK